MFDARSCCCTASKHLCSLVVLFIIVSRRKNVHLVGILAGVTYVLMNMNRSIMIFVLCSVIASNLLGEYTKTAF